MSDLLPCPFCGGDAYTEIYIIEAAAGCRECQFKVTRGHRPYEYDGLPKAIAAWNRRALPAAQPDPREAALREAADVDWASGLEIRDDAPDYLSEWQRGFVSGCTAFRNAILALKGETT